MIGGIGSRISQLLSKYPVIVQNFGYPDEFIPHGKTELLLEQIGFTADKLSELIIQDNPA
jgi:deoxyxylulose-5-phosphate synthase